MRFGKTLSRSMYPPWRDKYIDYARLKSLLREDRSDDDDDGNGEGDGARQWSEEDENRFCDEIFNVQLEKVARFQQERVDDLRARVDAALERLKDLVPEADTEASGGVSGAGASTATPDAGVGQDGPSSSPSGKDATARFRELEAELDGITKDVNRLKQYSSDNYTGFLKIVKKHDRKRGRRYKVRPMMQLSLAQRPFNSLQAYDSLLNKLSIMYFAIRQQLDEGGEQQTPSLERDAAEMHNGEKYTAHKFWVHPDNLLEVKTLILRRLPSLIYSEQAAKELDGNDSPSITSLYFDNDSFEVYSDKCERQSTASSLRLRWHGPLSDRPDVFFEQKIVDVHGNSEESKFTIKSKYIKSFLDGEYAMEKTVQKMERSGQPAAKVEAFKATVAKIRHFLQEKHLAPVLRANYVRTAFQKPADDRVRISIDTDLAFVREDTLDQSRPCRDPAEWHRLDIDDGKMTYPFKNVNQSEISKFPFAVLEIKLKEDSNRKRPSWIEDLMVSHLVHPAPRFSKFVHGVASLFEDYVNHLPFWLSDLEGDIRKDPQEAFEAEEQRRAQRADEAMAVGSLIGSVPSPYHPAKSSPVSKSHLSQRMAAEAQEHMSRSLGGKQKQKQTAGEEEGESSAAAAERTEQQRGAGGYGAISSVIPGFSLTKYSRAKRAQQQQQQQIQLPEGVVEPKQWIKNAGELKIEPKVWLANERTFLKWQHICILQGGLAVALYSAAGANGVAEAMGIIYIAIAAFAGAWGYVMLRVRRSMIVERSGKNFDNMAGPMVISAAMMMALVINFVLQYQKAFANMDDGKSFSQRFFDELR